MANDTKQTLRELLAGDIAYAVPGVYDALGARCAAKVGFSAIHVTGAGVSCSYGYPDLGLITMTEVLQRTREICTAINIPVIADADTGYGNAVNMYRTVQEFERAGAAGIHIEDQLSPKKCGQLAGKQVVPIQEMIQKIRAAVASRRNSNFIIIARTDARETLGLDEVISRCRAYLASGADCVFPMALESEEEVVEVGRMVAGPKMITATHGGKTPTLPLDRFASLGYRFVVYAMTPVLAAAHAMLNAMMVIKREGNDRAIGESMLTFKELYELVNIAMFEEWDKRFSA